MQSNYGHDRPIHCYPVWGSSRPGESARTRWPMFKLQTYNYLTRIQCTHPWVSMQTQSFIYPISTKKTETRAGYLLGTHPQICGETIILISIHVLSDFWNIAQYSCTQSFSGIWHSTHVLNHFLEYGTVPMYSIIFWNMAQYPCTQSFLEYSTVPMYSIIFGL